MSNIRQWLTDLGLGEYADAFAQNDLDFDVLADLSEADLEQVGVSLGHRKRLLRAIADLPDTSSRSRVDATQVEPRSFEGERRQATVLFSDLTGYTAMNEMLDPEDVERVMSRIKADAVEIVERHGGIVNQFVGDEVLALFGIPVAHDDDAVRAVRAAVELHERVREISPQVEAQIGASIRLHTGINTGLIVTHRGDGRDGRYGVTGDTVNVGARLKTLADPDAILLSPDTQKLTSSFFTCTAEAPVQLKGKSESMLVHRVTGTTSLASRFAAADRRHLTPFTGREREVALLETCFARVLDGEGQVVAISGDPGSGKSRLLYEFRQRVDADRVLFIHAGCPSSGRERSYAPFVDLVFAILELNDVDGSEAVLERVVANVVAIDPELEKYLPHYLDLLSISNDQYLLPPGFEGDEKRRVFEEALAGLFAFSSRKHPIVLALDDWQWSDEASDSALAYLIERIADLPIFVLVSHRQDYSAQWGELVHRSFTLEALEDGDIEMMMAGSLAASVLPTGLCELIRSRAGGNPLFIEEICKSLVEDGILLVSGGVATLVRPVEEIVIPTTVNGVIRGRLDRLDEVDKEPLRLAAVIGRDFSARILEHIHPNPDQARASLHALVAQRVIRPDDQSQDGYVFTHALVQTVTYETLLLQQRCEIHAQVGAAIEAVYADRLPSHYESLAFHFDLGRVWDKAVNYAVKAGVKALQHHVINAGLRLFDRAREILATHAPLVPPRLRYDLGFHYATAVGDRGQWLLALQVLTEVQGLAEAEGDTGLLIQAKAARANAAFWAQKFDLALEIMAELEARIGGSPAVQMRIAPQQASLNFMVERLPAALAKEKEAHALLRSSADSPNRNFAAFIVGVFLRWRGENEEAAKVLEVAVLHDKEKASAGVYLQSLMHYCLAIGERGQYQTAIDLLLEGREYGLAADSLYGVLKITNTLGWAYLEVCNFDTALEYNEVALQMVEEAKDGKTSTLSEVASFSRLNLVDIYLATDQLSLARAQLDLIATTLEHPDFALARTRWKPKYWLGQCEWALAAGDFDRAASWLAEVDGNVITQGFPFNKHQARAGRLRAAILHEQGKTDAALECLEVALSKARLVGNPTELWKLHLALGDTLLASGGDHADRHYGEAANVVERVAMELRDTSLASTFMNFPRIREVIAKASEAL